MYLCITIVAEDKNAVIFTHKQVMMLFHPEKVLMLRSGHQ